MGIVSDVSNVSDVSDVSDVSVVSDLSLDFTALYVLSRRNEFVCPFGSCADVAVVPFSDESLALHEGKMFFEFFTQAFVFVGVGVEDFDGVCWFCCHRSATCWLILHEITWKCQVEFNACIIHYVAIRRCRLRLFSLGSGMRNAPIVVVMKLRSRNKPSMPLVTGTSYYSSVPLPSLRRPPAPSWGR